MSSQPNRPRGNIRSKTTPPAASQPPHRPTMHTRAYTQPEDNRSHDRPWQTTEEWIAQQEALNRHVDMDGWLREQQIHTAKKLQQSRRDYYHQTAQNSNTANASLSEQLQQRIWEEMMYSCEIEAEKWMRQEEDLRRMAVEKERERERVRVAREEMRRMEAEFKQRRNEERRKLEEEHARGRVLFRMAEKRRALSDKTVLDAWKLYETRWPTLATSGEPLKFTDIPWPVAGSPARASEIVPSQIVSFLFSPVHSQQQSRKERLRAAQLRWHPDRFRRVMSRVVCGDKEIVEEGAGIVARVLNDLMSRESKKS